MEAGHGVYQNNNLGWWQYVPQSRVDLMLVIDVSSTLSARGKDWPKLTLGAKKFESKE